MPIFVAPGGIDPQPPVPPATQTQIESQLFTAVGITGAAGEYIVGDILERVVTYTGSVVSSEVWKNITQNTILTVVPPGVDIAQQSTSGLTDAELRAEAVDVFVVNPTEAIGLEPGADTTTYSEQFQALGDDVTNTPAQWSQGDVITREAVVDNATVPATITYTYFNETTGLPIDTTAPNVAPTSAELTQIVQQALTDAELRATPVEVIVTNQPAPGPAPTDNQTTVTLYEALNSDTVNTPAQWTAGDVLSYTTVYDYSTTPPTEISTEWFNQTTGLPIDTTLPKVGPSAADITAMPESVVPSSVVRGINIERISAATGTIAAGTTMIDIYVESGFAVVLGQYFTAGYSFSWSVDAPGETLGELVIDATSGTVLVSYTR